MRRPNLDEQWSAETRAWSQAGGIGCAIAALKRALRWYEDSGPRIEFPEEFQKERQIDVALHLREAKRIVDALLLRELNAGASSRSSARLDAEERRVRRGKG